MPSAIVVGATGILGRAIVSELSKAPETWNQIYALSRSKKGDYPPHVVHANLDLAASAEDIASVLKEMPAAYVFFAAYMQQDTEEEQTRVNGDLLDAFLRALEINGVPNLKRFILVTGAKQYGVQHGRVKLPMIETDPWLPEPPYEPNFYYRQQRSVHAFCEKNDVEWVVTYPSIVIGFAEGNFMDFGSALAIYAAVHKEVGTELPFPGGEAAYTRLGTFTGSALHAQFCAWAALEPRAGNQAFNVANGDTESWQNLWPRVAKRFGLKVPADQFSPARLNAEASSSRIEQRIELTRWAQTTGVRQAWQGLVDREGLANPHALEKATWDFIGHFLGIDFDMILSMSKARELGWTGYIDTWRNFENLFDELEAKKILPKTT
ncbi:hypothetical protein PT974_02999 [Cladobotryum mycophilum]|uniref:PRISE-like Rossmann-fold domain-containing protein n=1 Tax=Cladobotryum mycophilum TaxID=491253 RepID=A0ABR0T0V1_9HYPO